MSYRCARCGTENAATFKCNTTPKCRNGDFVNEVKRQTASYDHAGSAVGWGYEIDTAKSVYNGYSGTGSHKPQSAVYKKGTWGLSPDVSSHGGNNPAQQPCWKVFHQQGNKWVYWGSYNGELEQVERGGGIRNAHPPTT